MSRRPNDQSLEATDFNGPQVLNELKNKCFFYEDTKYIYRMCPFANVTQHEKTRYTYNFVTGSFHGILGIWKNWYIQDDKFHSLIYMDGDQWYC